MEVNDKVFFFRNNKNTSKPFNISGYISLGSWEETQTEAKGLNDAINETPSGIFTDGFGNTYTVIVEDFIITPLAAVNKYTFTMTLRQL